LRKIKLVSIITIGLALGLIIGQNTTPIQGHFLWFTGEMPAILLLLLTASGGFILGILVPLFIKKKQNINQITLK